MGSEDVFREVEALPFSPRPPLRSVWSRVRSAADFVSLNLPATGRLLVALRPYPEPFRLVEVPTSDGGALAAWIGEGRRGAPGLLLAPGTFHTKDDLVRRERALRIHKDWGWSVLVADLRGFGGSHRLQGSGGLLEAQDVLDAARFLRRTSGCSGVALLGESLGGAAALNAAARPEAAGLVSAVTAWSPFADLEEVVRHVTTGGADRMTKGVYRAMVIARSRGRLRGFDEYLAWRAETLGMTLADLVRASSPRHHVASIRAPTLVVHAEDDPIVPVSHARRLAEAAATNPAIRVRVLPAGGHLRFDEVDAAWYWKALETFLRKPAEATA